MRLRIWRPIVKHQQRKNTYNCIGNQSSDGSVISYVLRTLQRERDKLRGENRHLRAKKKGKMVMRDVD